MGRLFQLEHEYEEYRDYAAHVNYGARPYRAVRVDLSHNTARDTWCLVLSQENGTYGGFCEVITKDISAEEAAAFLALEDTRNMEAESNV